ncbi:hypothetical protein CRUP_018125 [Coryphaenoides rupestris]|nr:hypothetical protein CRUP_018125 [Coryphaenoides rupestris]
MATSRRLRASEEGPAVTRGPPPLSPQRPVLGPRGARGLMRRHGDCSWEEPDGAEERREFHALFSLRFVLNPHCGEPLLDLETLGDPGPGDRRPCDGGDVLANGFVDSVTLATLGMTFCSASTRTASMAMRPRVCRRSWPMRHTVLSFTTPCSVISDFISDSEAARNPRTSRWQYLSSPPPRISSGLRVQITLWRRCSSASPKSPYTLSPMTVGWKVSVMGFSEHS